MNIINHFRKRLSSNASIFFLLMWICILSYGLYIDQFGFYWDDWPPVFLARIGNPESFLTFYNFDRPFSPWTYLLTFPVLGTRPIYWQLFTLLLRSFAAFSCFLIFKELWPKQKSMAIGAASLFAVYPW